MKNIKKKMSPLISIATILSITGIVQGQIRNPKTTVPVSKCDADKCVPISECPHLWKLITKEVIPPHDTYTLREAHCGFQQHIPKVCCEPGVCKPSANLPDRHSGCCGNYSSTADRTVRFRGKEISIYQYPWLTYIDFLILNGEDKGKTTFACGGVLISSKFVLTAANCVSGHILDDYTPIDVNLGEFDSDEEGNCSLTKDGKNVSHCGDGLITMPIEKIIPHPKYRSSRGHNLALIKMKGSVPYTDIIRPICLPDVDITNTILSLSPNFKFILSAWGKIDEKWFGTKIKFYQKVPYINMTVCQSYVHRGGVLWEDHICAGGETHRNSCRVDYGAPLMYENDKVYDVHGVGSFGPSCAVKTSRPYVYTKVFKYTEWIRTTVYNELESQDVE